MQSWHSPCQESLLKVTHRLRVTMQHVYGHAGNLGNERADHAPPLGALGLVSNHDLPTRWTHHSFDSASFFATCQNLGDLEKLCAIRTGLAATSQHQNRSLHFVLHRVLHGSRACITPQVVISQPLSVSCASAASSSD